MEGGRDGGRKGGREGGKDDEGGCDGIILHIAVAAAKTVTSDTILHRNLVSNPGNESAM